MIEFRCAVQRPVFIFCQFTNFCIFLEPDIKTAQL